MDFREKRKKSQFSTFRSVFRDSKIVAIDFSTILSYRKVVLRIFLDLEIDFLDFLVDVRFFFEKSSTKPISF